MYPFNGGAMVADGKLYTYNTEHSTTQPVTRGWKVHCIDVFTGEGIWNITLSGNAGPVADGYLVVSSMDGYQYYFGKGKSATTVSAEPKVIANGASVLIEGTVTDQSPGAPGTPAISDVDMTEWMEYLYMQQPKPMDVIGVPVVLQAMRSDGSIIDIGTTYSDMNGHYEYLWTPPAQDVYKIFASFRRISA